MASQNEIAYWPQTGLFPTKVVGARFYREAIARVAQNPLGSSALAFCDATLVPQHDNPYDEHAVLVAVGHEEVGHLPRDLALEFRERLCSAGLVGQQTQCRAVITAGLEANDRVYDYIIELDLDLSMQPSAIEQPSTSIDRQDSNFHLDSQGNGKYLVKVWLGEGVLGRMDARKRIHTWTTDAWDTINYYVLNSQGIGLGHKLFSVPKAEHVRLFGNAATTANFESLVGRNATIEVTAGG